eukprot:SAG11_NODE_8606_length_996_cov_0.936455_2_plen_157_part_00
MLKKTKRPVGVQSRGGSGSADDAENYMKKFQEILKDVPVFFKEWYDDQTNEEKLIELAKQFSTPETLAQMSAHQITYCYVLLNPQKTSQSSNIIGKLPAGPKGDSFSRREKLRDQIVRWAERVFAMVVQPLPTIVHCTYLYVALPTAIPSIDHVLV